MKGRFRLNRAAGINTIGSCGRTEPLSDPSARANEGVGASEGLPTFADDAVTTEVTTEDTMEDTMEADARVRPQSVSDE